MAYCTNCGSILPNNANFCHVCGTKVVFDDRFEQPKEEPKVEEKVEPNTNFYRSYYDEYNTYSASDTTSDYTPRTPKKSFLIGLIGMIASVGTCAEAGLMYLISILLYNESYNSGVISYAEYSEYVKQTLSSSAVYLILAMIAGGVLGVLGFITARKYSSKKGKIFSIVALVFAVVALGFAILALVTKGML